MSSVAPPLEVDLGGEKLILERPSDEDLKGLHRAVALLGGVESEGDVVMSFVRCLPPEDALLFSSRACRITDPLDMKDTLYVARRVRDHFPLAAN